MLKSLFVSLMLVVSCTHIVFAQARNVTIEQYDIKSLTLKNGLVQSSVRDMLQDTDGLIWLGTEAGIQIYDGLNLKRLNQYISNESNPILSGLWVNQLFEATNGNILISTRNHGLFKFNHDTRLLQQFSANGFEPLFSDRSTFHQVCQDTQGDVWAATDGGLLQLDLSQGRWKTILSNTEHKRYTNIACFNDSIVVRLENSLIKWNKLSRQSKILTINSDIDNNDSIVIKPITPLFTLIGKQDGLFRLSNDFSRLIKIWPNPLHGEQLTTQLVNNQVNDILYHSEQSVWLGTQYHGMLLVDVADGNIQQQLKSMPDNPFSISSDNVTRLIRDHSQLIWASINGVGVNRVFMDKTPMKTYYTYSENPRITNDVTAISAGTDESMWLSANHSGIRRLSQTDNASVSFTRQFINIYQGYFAAELPYIADIEVDDSQNLWVTTKKGIFSVNTTTFEHQFFPRKKNNPDGPSSPGQDIFEDRSGRIYITDVGSILRYEPLSSKLTKITISQSPSLDANTRLKRIAQHPNGSIYVLAEHNIYLVDDDDSLKAMLAPNQIKTEFEGQLRSFSITKDGHFFIAARGALIEVNMSKSNQPLVKVYTDSSLQDSYFYAIELDNSDNPWLSSNNGIVRFDRQALSFNQFGLSDGVLVREFNRRTSLKRSNGSIIFGGINGWTLVAPEHNVLNTSPPRLALSSLQIDDNAPVSFLPKDGIKLDYAEHWLKFSFSALDFHSPEENRYSFKLEGKDTDWRDFGNAAQIVLTGLPPGKYTLHARASTKRGQWHPEPLSVGLIISPPFYRSSMAFFGYIALFILMIVLYQRYRRKLTDERADYAGQIATSEQRTKLALWGSGDSIWDWCLENDKVFRTSLHFLGYEKEDDIGTNINAFKKLIHPQDREHFEYEVGEVLVGHTAEYTAQYRLKDKNGDWHWVADQGKVIESTASKRPLRLSGTIRDISLIKRHEQELQKLNEELEKKVAAQEIESASKSEQLTDTLGNLKNTQDQLVESEKKASLGNLVAGISHEINTPVGIALTAASHNTLAIGHLQDLFLQRKLTVKEMEKGLRQLKSSNEKIESSINRTAQLIHTFKQVVVDHDQHEWRIIELPFYLIEIVPTFNTQLGGANFILEVIDGPFFDAESSPGDLYQIISQLVHNSVAHGFRGREHGKIVIETELKDDEWILRYEDNGNGIDEETKSQIFDPFYTTRRDDGFAGLGMHMVSNIVNHSLGGAIKCHSEIGKGVKFVMSMPLRRPNSPSLDMLQGFMI